MRHNQQYPQILADFLRRAIRLDLRMTASSTFGHGIYRNYAAKIHDGSTLDDGKHKEYKTLEWYRQQQIANNVTWVQQYSRLG